MMQLEFGGKRYPIIAGETVIGTAPGCAVVLPGDGVQSKHAVVYGSPAGAAIRSAGPAAEVLINGVLLGGDPTPVLHGDKIQIGSHELLAVDSERAGRTQLFDSHGGGLGHLMAAAGPSAMAAPASARLICLTDGREYVVVEQVAIGRDAAADVVVTDFEVSRQHATIRSTPDGYLLTDESANGTYVNGTRMGRTHLLAHSDVIRIGNDEFRFDAGSDVAGEVLGASQAAMPTGATYRLSDTMHGVPAAALRRETPPAVPAPLLASFLVRNGPSRGERLRVRAAAVEIGRGDHNEVVITDQSVSVMHAKLQWHDGLWMLTDVGSTNGTYVDGERVTEETPLLSGAMVRFGELVVLFETHDEPADIEPVTRPRASHPIETPRVVEASPPISDDSPAVEAPLAETAGRGLELQDPAAGSAPMRPLRTPRPASEDRRGIPGWFIVAALIAAAAGAAAGFLLLR